MFARAVRVPVLVTVAALSLTAVWSPPPLHAQSVGTIRGTITAEGSNRPLSAAQVFVAGTSLGTQTNEAGEYRITNVPAGTRELRVQRIGFSPTSRSITVADGGTLTIDFALREAPVALEQVVVTATGDVRKKEITNSLASISSDAIGKSQAQNAQQILTASSPGITVLGNSGQPGTGGTIKLRGNNSISQGNNPIIYVDGVRIFSGAAPNNSQARQHVNPLNDINAEDIDRVDIVKGAAATTLYGTEASGGVIQIFTKRGRAGTPRWNLEVTGGTNDLNHIGPKGDPTGLFLKECRGAGLTGIDVTTTSKTFGQEVVFEDPTCPSSGSWIRAGAIQRFTGSVSGGSENMRYFTSAKYSDEEGALPTNGTKDGGFRGNFAYHPLQTLELQLNMSYAKNQVQWVPDGNNANGVLLNIGRGPNSNFKGGGCANPSAVCLSNADIFKIQSFTRSDHYITGFTLNYSPWEKLTNRFTVGYDYNSSENRVVIPFGALRNPLGQITQGAWTRKFLSMDYAGTFSNSFAGSMTSRFSWGGQLFADNLISANATGDEFGGPGDPTLSTAARTQITSDTRRRVINAGLFLQEEYSWNDRLFVNLGLRVDGNSAFGQDFGLQKYPKIGLSYVLSDHDFWPTWWETLKLRAALGESGKAPGAFDAVRTWTSIAGDHAKPGFTPNQLGNSKLGPERTREMELGFETSVDAGRYSADVTYFDTRTMDALIQVRYAPSQGFLNRQLENVGEIHNRGLEAKFEAGLLRGKRADWRGRINYTQIKSEASDLGGESEISLGNATYVRKGIAVPALFVRRVLNPNKIEAPLVSDSIMFGGATFPEKIIGLGTTLTLFNRLTIDALGEFQRGAYNTNFTGYQNALRGVWKACIPVQQKLIAAMKGDASALDDVKAIDRARCAVDRTAQNSDFWVEPTDFFKLRHVSVTYDIPARFIPGARTASISLAGRNIFTSTDYTGLDGESADQSDNSFARREYYTLPALRTFTAALRLSF